MGTVLHIDIETFSDVDLKTCGLFRYIESPAFEILLFAYAFDDNPVQIIDISSGERLPQEVLSALSSPAVTKTAWNATFEMACLAKALRGRSIPLPLEQWQDTMVVSRYAALPGSLSGAGAALKLPEDKAKMREGAALIKYFCCPCKPTKTNGSRSRNLPHHDPEKWELFKRYCVRDVETERTIHHILAPFDPPEEVWSQWRIDQTINFHGVQVDRPLAQGAISLDTAHKNDLISEAVRLTGLQNPKSVKQLSEWLSSETGVEVGSLSKEFVSSMMQEDNSDTVQRVLELRQQTSKSSTAKYAALENIVCMDSRVRGTMQFYGSRTGRWAGRFVQVQNLPRTYVHPLDLARDLITKRNAPAIEAVYGSLPQVLSEMIRTAFTASPGNVLMDADFSAIEARVLAWLAGEKWVLEVFRGHGKIYEAAASQMFGVPIERITKGNPEYELRGKGKVATLALGYQGGANALIAMGALKMGLSEAELPDIVTRWRKANSRIQSLWYAVQDAAIKAVSESVSIGVNGLIFAKEILSGLPVLTIKLPSGRKLYYHNPRIGENRWGSPSLSFYGVGTGGRWGKDETYGGKLTENIVQAIARDCLAETLSRLEAAGFPIVMHIHDEVVIDCPIEKANLSKVLSIMSLPMPWAPDLPLAADGWTGPYFKKD